MYNTNYKCVKPFDVWLDAIGPDGKKIPYRVKRGTIWRLEWRGGEQSFKELSGPDKMHITLPDEYIEQQAGKSIAQIFEEDGEEAFRQIETETLVRLRDSLHNTVVATGGGMPLRKENARLLKEIGRVNYLTATSREIYDRVKGDTKRPLLQMENPYERICNMMQERKPKYEAACDRVIDTNSNDIEEIIAAIIKK